jgi:hypothetical protein
LGDTGVPGEVGAGPDGEDEVAFEAGEGDGAVGVFAAEDAVGVETEAVAVEGEGARGRRRRR